MHFFSLLKTFQGKEEVVTPLTHFCYNIKLFNVTVIIAELTE